MIPPAALLRREQSDDSSTVFSLIHPLAKFLLILLREVRASLNHIEPHPDRRSGECPSEVTDPGRSGTKADSSLRSE